MYYIYKAIFYILEWTAVIFMLPIAIVYPCAWIGNYLFNSANRVRRYAIEKYKDKYNKEVNRK